ncbi:hypothetical protein [Rhodococcus marinonascens]|nr:hypothetical protein [Rhodococcus marinonascens]
MGEGAPGMLQIIAPAPDGGDTATAARAADGIAMVNRGNQHAMAATS